MRNWNGEAIAGQVHFDFYEGTESARDGTKGAVEIGGCSTEGHWMQTIDDAEVYRAALDSLPAGVYLVDRKGRILFWNSGAERITGYLRQDVVGHSSLEDLLGHLDGENNKVAADALPVSIVLREGKASFAQVSIRHKSGHRVLARLHAAPIRDAHGMLIGAVESFEEAVFSSPTDERQSKLQAYGCIDEVSGVLNHAMVQAHLRETLVTFAEHPVPFSILCIGIDELDSIKLRYGGGAVAAVIRVVGQTLENSLRPTDIIGRWMENEFVAVLMECGGDEVVKVGERLRKMANQCKVEWWGDQLHLTVSMGGTDAKQDDTLETILQRAETGLRESIRQGGNRVVFWSEIKSVNS